MDDILNLSKAIYKVLDDRKAQDLVVLSVKGISPISDYFIICTGTSTTHMNALADHVRKELSALGVQLRHKEGKDTGGWLLMDYKDVIVHIFSRDMRDYYGLERIWSDAALINF